MAFVISIYNAGTSKYFTGNNKRWMMPLDFHQITTKNTHSFFVLWFSACWWWRVKFIAGTSYLKLRHTEILAWSSICKVELSLLVFLIKNFLNSYDYLPPNVSKKNLILLKQYCKDNFCTFIAPRTIGEIIQMDYTINKLVLVESEDETLGLIFYVMLFSGTSKHPMVLLIRFEFKSNGWHSSKTNR